MCIIGEARRNVKRVGDTPRESGSDRKPPRRPKKLGAGELGPEDPGLAKQSRSSVAALLACSRFKSPEGERHVQLPPAGIGPSTERRVLPRIKGLTLTAAERSRARSMFAKALGCRTRFVALRKAQEAPGGAIESRLLIAMPCGSRMCEDCDRERREYEASRVLGEWRLFWTIGIPSRGLDVGATWRKVGGWVGKLFREIRRELKDNGQQKIKFDQSEETRIAAINEALPEGKRKLALLQYAWCLEPHKSGFPHVHFVVNARWIGREWLKRLWSKIIKRYVQHATFKIVKNIGGVCLYLSKYISKTSFPPDLVALMYRRRQWASTVPKAKTPEREWRLERKIEGASLPLEVDQPEGFARAFGWKVDMAKRGCYALFSRFLTQTEFDEKKRLESFGEEYIAPNWFKSCVESERLGGLEGLRQRLRLEESLPAINFD